MSQWNPGETATMSDKDITCPDCGHTFSKGEAAWTVCLGCGFIAEPGDEMIDVHPGEHGPGTDCFQFVNRYTEAAAEQKAKGVKSCQTVE